MDSFFINFSILSSILGNVYLLDLLQILIKQSVCCGWKRKMKKERERENDRQRKRIELNANFFSLTLEYESYLLQAIVNRVYRAEKRYLQPSL